jgi:shikimate kinase
VLRTPKFESTQLVKTKNFILIGAMGAGKSIVGRRLAKRLRIQFYDSDKIMEERTGVNIPTVFEYEGESGFRAREERIISDLCQLEDIVLATGGGAILSKNTRKKLSATGTVFYLKASVGTLLNRTKNDANRPLLKTNNRRQVVSALLKKREPLYQEAADYIITTDRRTTNWTVNQIIKYVEQM